jgi:hypothetical protein
LLCGAASYDVRLRAPRVAHEHWEWHSRVDAPVNDHGECRASWATISIETPKRRMALDEGG